MPGDTSVNNQGKLMPGSRVMLMNMTADREVYNGAFATLLEWEPLKGEWKVQVDNGFILELVPENIM